MLPSTQPIARSPLEALHRRNGATVELRGGCMVAMHYPDEPGRGGNAIVDFAHRPTWEINGPDVSRKLADLLGRDVALRRIHGESGWLAYRLTAGRALVFGKIPNASGDRAIDVTGGWLTLALFGADAESILNKVTAVDLRERTLPVHGCCQGPIFGVNTLFGRYADRFELHICGDSAEFLWEVLLDAGHDFNLKPAGVEFAARTLY
jgi:glycine cleavage system aminomethyltransferase T